MARKPRLHYSGALYHVILRGNRKQDIFVEDDDRCRFYLLLQEGIERYHHRVHAFCLMTNHVHLAVQVADISLSRIMQNLSFRYTRWANWRHGKTGHLFQGRYKAILVDTDAYLAGLVRYLHLNPVRAGMVKDPLEYPWSSHRSYCGIETVPWLATDLTLSSFSKRRGIAQREFQRFVLEGIDEGHRPEFHGGSALDSRLLGDDAFMDRVMAKSNELPVRRIGIQAVIAAVCRHYAIDNDELRNGTHRSSHARAMAAWLALETEGCTITELARLTGRDLSTLSSRARRLQERARLDVGLKTEREEILMGNCKSASLAPA